MPTNIQHATTDPAFDNAYSRGLQITPDDAADLAEPTRALHVHAVSAGSIQVTVTFVGDEDGTSTVLNLAHATIAPIRVKRVWLTGTDAGAYIVALY